MVCVCVCNYIKPTTGLVSVCVCGRWGAYHVHQRCGGQSAMHQLQKETCSGGEEEGEGEGEYWYILNA